MNDAMAESIEQVMKRIHLLFAKCKQYHEDDAMIIVPKRKLFDLLQELNYAVSELMDQYEATQRSRELALKKFREQKEQIEMETTQVSEDIYAASMLYTDRMLLELREMVEKAGRDIRKEYEFLASQLESQAAMFSENQMELRDQLGTLNQGQKYKEIIQEYNVRQEQKKREELEQEESFSQQDPEQPENISYLQQEAGKNLLPYSENEDRKTPEASKRDEFVVQKTSSSLFTSAKEETSAGKQSDLFEEEPDVIVVSEWKRREDKKPANKKEENKKKSVGLQRDSEFAELSDKEQTEPEQIKIRKRPVLPPPPANGARPPVRKIASIVDESALGSVGELNDLNDTPKAVSYEIKVNQSWYGSMGGLRPEDLDAEYDQWKEQQETIEEEKETSPAENQKKKDKKFLFGRKK